MRVQVRGRGCLDPGGEMLSCIEFELHLFAHEGGDGDGSGGQALE